MVTLTEQVDVLPSENQASCQFIVIVINDITGKSCEQRLITKEHIAGMHLENMLKGG